MFEKRYLEAGEGGRFMPEANRDRVGLHAAMFLPR